MTLLLLYRATMVSVSRPHVLSIRCKVTGNNAWHFSQYVPSAWENEWIANKDQWNGKVCATMVTYAVQLTIQHAHPNGRSSHRQSVNSQQWLDDVAALHNDFQELDTWGFQHLKPSIWSFVEYVNPCLPSSDPSRVLRVPIEPLVGLMRHPYTPTPCVPPGKEMANPESRDYLLVNAMVRRCFYLFVVIIVYFHHCHCSCYFCCSIIVIVVWVASQWSWLYPQPPRVLQHLYPGRAWLFDLGTQTYKTSIGALVAMRVLLMWCCCQTYSVCVVCSDTQKLQAPTI